MFCAIIEAMDTIGYYEIAKDCSIPAGSLEPVGAGLYLNFIKSAGP